MGCLSSKKRNCIYYNYKTNNFILCYCSINDSFGYNYHIIIDNCNKNEFEGVFGFLNLNYKFNIKNYKFGIIKETDIIILMNENNIKESKIKYILERMKINPLFEGEI